MTSAKILLGFFLHRSVVQAHMPWMMLSEGDHAVNLYYGEGIIADPDMITTLESVNELDFINADGTTEKVSIHETDSGFKHGHLPKDYVRPATVAGFLDYGDFGEGLELHYTFTTQAYSADASKDWEQFFQNFDWVNKLYKDGAHSHPPLFATMKNFGGPPYKLAVNGIPGMTSIQGCVYTMHHETGEEIEMGCTEQEVQDYTGNSMVVEINLLEEALCAGQVYFFRARTRGNYDPKEDVSISSYATGSVIWDAMGKACPQHLHSSTSDDAEQSDHTSHDTDQSKVDDAEQSDHTSHDTDQSKVTYLRTN